MSRRITNRSQGKIIIGNWKMNPESQKEAEKWIAAISKSIKGIRKTEVVIAAPFVYLNNLKKISRKIILAAQDAYPGDTGPFTGQVSAGMLYSLGIRYVILGHSERRAIGETNEDINKKVKGALAAGLTPIICVGENERDEKHAYFNIVKSQVEECLRGIPKASISRIILAYEPVWALSSTPGRRDATAEDSKEMAMFIRKVLSVISTPEIAKDTRVIYGGSVNEKDAGEFLGHGGVDGALPGRASLDPKKFSAIVNICEALSK